MIDIDIQRAITIALSLVAFISWFGWLIRHPRKWGYALWILLWVANIIGFYVAILFFNLHNPEILNTWSIIIRWQALISAIGACFIFWRNGYHKDRDINYV